MAGIDPTTRPAAGTLPNQLLTAISQATGPPGLYQTSLLQSLRQNTTKSPAVTPPASRPKPTADSRQTSVREAIADRPDQNTAGRTESRRTTESTGQSQRSETAASSQTPARTSSKTSTAQDPSRSPSADTEGRLTPSSTTGGQTEASESEASKPAADRPADDSQQSGRSTREGTPPGSLADLLKGGSKSTVEPSEPTEIADDPTLDQLLDEISASLGATDPQNQPVQPAMGAEQPGEISEEGELQAANSSGEPLTPDVEIPDVAVTGQPASKTEDSTSRQNSAVSDPAAGVQPEADSGTAISRQPEVIAAVHHTAADDDATESETDSSVPNLQQVAGGSGTEPTDSTTPDFAESHEPTRRDQRTDRSQENSSAPNEGTTQQQGHSPVSGAGLSTQTVPGQDGGTPVAPLPAADGARTTGAAASRGQNTLTATAAVAGNSGENANQPLDSSPRTNSTTPGVISGGETGAGTSTAETTTTIDTRQTELANRVAAAMKQMRPGGGQLRILLHPEQLGDLRIELVQKGGEVTARLEVQTAEAQQLLTEQLSQLQDSLARRGMKVDSIQIELGTRRTGEPQEAQRQQNSGQQQGGNQQGGHSGHQQGSTGDQSRQDRRSPDGEPTAEEPPGQLAA